MIEKNYERNGEQIDKLIYTGNQPNTPARIHPYVAYRWLVLDTDGAKTTVSVVNGLKELRDEQRKLLDYNGTTLLDVGGETVEIEVSDGTATREIETEEPVEVQAVGLSDHPAEPSNTVVIEP